MSLLKTNPFLWLEVFLLYPLLSAYTQEILFRSFFFHRYEKLFKGRLFSLIMVNALLFAYMHVVFGNWIAVIFTFIGGILFAQTYLKTRSTMLTAIEHALYGNTLFTLGLGYYFYHGVHM
ncbi:MAG: CPBP family intramembrane glutamic endopeptidase [Sulfurimonadaceae bacterium]